MTHETIVAVYDTVAHADAAVRELEVANVPSNAISRHSGASGATGTGEVRLAHEQGFWASLFGGEPDHDTSIYDRSVEAGASVVTVKVPETDVERVTAILERHSPIDIDEQAAAYSTATGATTTTTTTTTATAPGVGARAQETAVRKDGGESIELAEEQLNVGKRLVNRGTTRIRRFVVETPVEEAVTLHSERVSIQRRPLAAGTAVPDGSFTDRTIEVTETDEEAVVAKTVRVKEEVIISKEANERVETVRDTVRREDVEITRDGKASETTSTTDPRFPAGRPPI